MMCCLDLHASFKMFQTCIALESGPRLMGARLSSKIPLGHHDMDKPTSLRISGSSKTLDHQKPWSHFWIIKNHDLDKPHETIWNLYFFWGESPQGFPFSSLQICWIWAREIRHIFLHALAPHWARASEISNEKHCIQWLLVEQMFLQRDLYW